MKCDVLVLGAGAAGLACRAGLRGRRSVVVLEREEEPGGLLRVFFQGDYVFDTTVHVMFFRNETLREQLFGRFTGGVHQFRKICAVWQKGAVIPYPYQHHIASMPTEIGRDCLNGFLNNPWADTKGVSFRDWLLAQFGQGFYRHFFEPYNTKLYGVSPEHLVAEPMTWSIPADNWGAVLEGASQEPREPARATTCFYPLGKAGIQAVPQALEALGDGSIHLGREVVSVDPYNRVATTHDGTRWSYRSLVHSLPLPAFVELLTEAPQEVQSAADSLGAAPVSVLRIGSRTSGEGLPFQWTYFPDPEIPFYRLVRLEAISPEFAPHGGCSLLLECPGTDPPDWESIFSLLEELDVLRDKKDVEVYETHTVSYAYVLFTPGYEKARDCIQRHLAGFDIQSVGRYGEWVYGNIETTILSGLRAADALTRHHGAGPAVLK